MSRRPSCLLDKGGKIHENGKARPQHSLHTAVSAEAQICDSCRGSVIYRAYKLLCLIDAKGSCTSQATWWSALAADAAVLMQLTDLADSGLSGKIQHIPENMYDLDADWEIDPKSLTLMEKIGMASSSSERLATALGSYMLTL